MSSRAAARPLDNAVRDLRIQVDDITAEQKRADADVEQVKTRRVRDQGMIDAGQIKDPKALERMLGELQSLHRRINDLEDVEIEVMERLEEAQRSLDERTAELAGLETRERRRCGRRTRRPRRTSGPARRGARASATPPRTGCPRT